MWTTPIFTTTRTSGRTTSVSRLLPQAGLQGRARASRRLDATDRCCMPPRYRPAMPQASRAALYDASHHRPRFADVTDSGEPMQRCQSGKLRGARAMAQRRMADSVQLARCMAAACERQRRRAAMTRTTPPRCGRRKAARQAYESDRGSAMRGGRCRTLAQADPHRDDDSRSFWRLIAVEAERRRSNTQESPTKDAALADRDVAYNEYIHRLTTASKRP